MTNKKAPNQPIERVVIGQIVGAFGLRGQVKVKQVSAFESRFDEGNIVFIDGKKHTIEKSQFHKGRPLLKLSGMNTMSEAELFQWKELEAEGEPDLSEDEFLISELIDMKVVTVEGEELGTVTSVDDYPAHEVVVINKQILVPMVSEFIKDIDLDNHVMTVQLIYGMRPGEE